MEPEKQEETVVEATEQVKTEQESAPANEPGQDKGALAPDDTSAEAQLAAEALEAADTVPVGVVAGLRARSRGKDEVIRGRSLELQYVHLCKEFAHQAPFVALH